MTIKMIAAVAKNGVIGRDGKIPWHIPEELKRFRESVRGKIVVCGRKTFETLPRSLAPSVAFVVTSKHLSDDELPKAGAVMCMGIERAVQMATSMSNMGSEVCVIGGASIYERFMPLADALVISRIDLELDGDAFFPSIGIGEWSIWLGKPEPGEPIWSAVEIYRRRSRL